MNYSSYSMGEANEENKSGRAITVESDDYNGGRAAANPVVR